MSVIFVWSAVSDLLWSSWTMCLINPKPDCHFFVRRIARVTQSSISDISLMCFERHTCILRKHSVRLELISLISLQLWATDLKEQCQASAISHSPKICALYSEYQIPPKTSRCICVARCSCVLSLQSAWLNVKGQVLEFGRRTKSTVGNLTFK